MLLVRDAVGVEADSEKLSKLLSEVAGKDINELIAEGKGKLASLPAGGAVAAAPAAGGAAPAAAAAPAAKKEEKKEESEQEVSVHEQRSSLSRLHAPGVGGRETGTPGAGSPPDLRVCPPACLTHAGHGLQPVRLSGGRRTVAQWAGGTAAAEHHDGRIGRVLINTPWGGAAAGSLWLAARSAPDATPS